MERRVFLGGLTGDFSSLADLLGDPVLRMAVDHALDPWLIVPGGTAKWILLALRAEYAARSRDKRASQPGAEHSQMNATRRCP